MVFAQAHYVGPDGYTRKHYYVHESVGIALPVRGRVSRGFGMLNRLG